VKFQTIRLLNQKKTNKMNKRPMKDI
jgi:hypothetical protein